MQKQNKMLKLQKLFPDVSKEGHKKTSLVLSLRRKVSDPC